MTKRKKVCRLCGNTEKEADAAQAIVQKNVQRQNDIIEEHRAFGAYRERKRIVAALIVLADDYDNSAHEDGAVALRYFAEALTGDALPSPAMQRALDGGVTRG